MSYEVKFSYCDTRSTFDRAISGLRSSRVLLLDCEGLDIGMQGGALSLICVGTESAKAIYVFDVPMLRDNGVNVNPLLRLLMREDITKITWDGRMDFLEIYETYGIEMKGVLDLQLAEVMSRKGVRKEGERQRTHRLATRYFGFQAVKTQQELFKGIHIVLGMTQCLKDNNLGEGVEKDPQVVAMHRANGSALWMERPLSERLLRYAATDIYLISLLYEDFLTRGWINRKSTQGLCAYSQEYVSTYQDLGRLDADNVLQKGPLIMLWELEGERKHECSGCGRFKPIECYVTRQDRFAPNHLTGTNSGAVFF
ncbi:hypothetical protein GLOTRDRAFT_123248 [Gloeophyllum trabeum ATCC 11539]|uniref:3'-5' exonuclease domain-containing protein n=1 Tax=Gloeophyllum trabeum (strain ATCC 11539 / FP-39264 / Madison 617) TaxID=670483 RepID=S7RAN3_GLOTA|nr:uncharacterized protein GLOTRDRAFT_123248 [Gloeophyllum trabeum ATCC 11539]EPQ51320.1 hypothetical protein GLOTRDRAFT_123248 [Gloeophyllum trabeum ATCC 11539]